MVRKAPRYCCSAPPSVCLSFSPSFVTFFFELPVLLLVFFLRFGKSPFEISYSPPLPQPLNERSLTSSVRHFTSALSRREKEKKPLKPEKNHTGKMGKTRYIIFESLAASYCTSTLLNSRFIFSRNADGGL
ncbi:hypothetical protein EX30DRAFT_43116 [Ascodesmis nigricans]|uniref:Transmembrane protein n=1 Tax=Ascodesmis nigricans TaxID=341454 RepID=A0A4S2MW84_9PEZI|nr:hypothetical protein EX30DRAFT_43116 [Ascodesmis nigricans]